MNMRIFFFASDDGVFDVVYVVGWLVGWLLVCLLAWILGESGNWGMGQICWKSGRGGEGGGVCDNPKAPTSLIRKYLISFPAWFSES